MTFQTDRAVLVLAHIKAKTAYDVDEATGYIEVGQVGWNQNTFGELVTTTADVARIFGSDVDTEDDNITVQGGVRVNDRCGTAGCLAGWALFLSGVEQEWRRDEEYGGFVEYQLIGSADGRETATFAVDWLGIPIPEGLDERNARGNLMWEPLLFRAGNSYDTLVREVAKYAGVEPSVIHTLVDAEVERVKRRIHQAEVEDKRLIAGVNV